MTIKPASAKAKGRNLQKFVAKTVVDKYDTLEPDDVVSRSMGANGTDIMLSPAAKKLFPFSVECKNIAAFAGYNFYDQSKANTLPGTSPIVVVKANNKEPLVLISFSDFMKLI